MCKQNTHVLASSVVSKPENPCNSLFPLPKPQNYNRQNGSRVFFRHRSLERKCNLSLAALKHKRVTSNCQKGVCFKVSFVQLPQTERPNKGQAYCSPCTQVRVVPLRQRVTVVHVNAPYALYTAVLSACSVVWWIHSCKHVSSKATKAPRIVAKDTRSAPRPPHTHTHTQAV